MCPVKSAQLFVDRGVHFFLDFPADEVSVRNPDRSFHGVCDLCIEFLSDSTPAEMERDTVHKKEEYAKVGVPEYYILDSLRKHTAFYALNE